MPYNPSEPKQSPSNRQQQRGLSPITLPTTNCTVGGGGGSTTLLLQLVRNSIISHQISVSMPYMQLPSPAHRPPPVLLLVFRGVWATRLSSLNPPPLIMKLDVVGLSFYTIIKRNKKEHDRERQPSLLVAVNRTVYARAACIPRRLVLNVFIHNKPKTHQVEGRLLLDVVVRQSPPVFQLLAGED